MSTQRRDSFLVIYIVAFVVVAVAAGAVYWFWSAKQQRLGEESKVRAAQLDAGPTIVVANSSRGPSFRKISLIGEALPYKTATLYAKLGGYLTRIAVDKGDHVKTGQFIAEVQSPETEAQYRGALADLENKQRLHDRARDLAAKGFYSAQALDNSQTDVRVAQDHVSELRIMLGYRSLQAPFAGTVTARFVDLGALVTNATSNQSSAQPVVTISDTSRLRVTLYVEQGDAAMVKPGTEVEIGDSANPAALRAKAKVSRISGGLDPKTRTLLTEVDLDNSKGEFIAGSFVNVSVLLPAQSYVEVPAPALVTRAGKALVAVVGDDNHVKLTPIEVAGTDGKTIRVASGIGENVRVALNLPNTVPDGAKINPAMPPGAPVSQPVAAPPAGQPAPAGNSKPK
jgi:membrane fusion protein (multidrug efflux system)